MIGFGALIVVLLTLVVAIIAAFKPKEIDRPPARNAVYFDHITEADRL
jgi:hypothetical protein